jgi:hypothetical protein
LRQFKKLERQSNKHQNAFVKVLFFNSVATPEDYRLLGFATANTPLLWPPDVGPRGACSSLEDVNWGLHAQYPQPDVPSHGSAVLGLPDGAAIIRLGAPKQADRWLRLVNASFGSAAWTLVAAAAYMTALDHGVLQWLDDIGWFDHRLSDSIEVGKSRFVAARRTLTLAGQDTLSVDAVLMLRKIASFADRNRDEADWTAEQHRRTVDTPVHYYPEADGGMSRTKWLDYSRDWLMYFTRKIAWDMSGKLRLEDLNQWWQGRFSWVPSGSSGSAAEARKAMEETEGMQPDVGSRPNKKAVAMMYDDIYPLVALLSRPTKKPRISTKHEPGRKNRALYAQDDVSFFVTAYASVAMERSINEDGIYARQAPEDVVNWLRHHQFYSSQGCYFLSLDYSDYNSEHETITLAMLDACWAKAWLEVSGGRTMYVQKSMCALWTAYSHLNSWVDFGSGDVRILGGLFSGDRNTSRDNCILHAMYSHHMQKAAKEILPDFAIYALCMTGDDEDAAFSSWVDSMVYMGLHAKARFVLKVEKQLSGSAAVPTHEYLQRAVTMDGRASRPLAAALAQMLSGNWYKEQYTWFDGIINSVNSNAWELFTRGLPIQVCRYMAGKVLSRTMCVKTSDGWVDLEWWNYRSGGSYSPLWGCTTQQPPDLPDPKEVVSGGVVTSGMLAWAKKNTRRFGSLLPRAKLDRYLITCSRQAFGSAYVKSRFERLSEAASESWPQRVTFGLDYGVSTMALPPLVASVRLTNLLAISSVNKRPVDSRELLSRFGMDNDLLEAIGGWKNFLMHMEPGDMQYWENPTQPGQPPMWLHNEDPAIRSYLLGVVAHAQAQYDNFVVNVSTHSLYHIVLAGNAAGKSSVMSSRYSSSCIDLDDLMRECGVLRMLRLSQMRRFQQLDQTYVERMCKLLQQSSACILLTQYPMVWVEQLVRAAKSSIGLVVCVNIGVMDLWERTVSTRGWQYAKADRRHTRFEKTLDVWSSRYNVLQSPSVQDAVVLISKKIEESSFNSIKTQSVSNN